MAGGGMAGQQGGMAGQQGGMPGQQMAQPLMGAMRNQALGQQPMGRPMGQPLGAPVPTPYNTTPDLSQQIGQVLQAQPIGQQPQVQQAAPFTPDLVLSGAPRGTQMDLSQDAYRTFLAQVNPAQGQALPSYDQWVQLRQGPGQPMTPQQLQQMMGPQQKALSMQQMQQMQQLKQQLDQRYRQPQQATPQVQPASRPGFLGGTNAGVYGAPSTMGGIGNLLAGLGPMGRRK